ncbi:hypothetical protein FRC17_007884, partial [Serendipita sp. 399]
MCHWALADQKLLSKSEQVRPFPNSHWPGELPLSFPMGISRLPTELLRQVLQEASSERGPHGTRTSPYPRRLLLAVCFQWRDIVLNTPELWSYVPVSLVKTIQHGKESTFQNALAILDLDLQRSGSQLLD